MPQHCEQAHNPDSVARALEIARLRRRIAALEAGCPLQAHSDAPPAPADDGGISVRQRADDILRSRLRISELASVSSEEQLLRFTLDEAERLTGSCIGFFHYVDDDQVTLCLQMWSSNTLNNMCTAEGKGSHYPVSAAGVWVDCVRERAPVIHNDYAALPHKKGLPPGHAPVVRELVVPVIIEEKLVAIIGVGNKATPYDVEDIQTAATFAHLAWDVIRRKRAEEELRAVNQHLLASSQQLRATEQQLRASNHQLAAGVARLAEAQAIAHLGSWELDFASGQVACSEELFRIAGLEYQPAPIPFATLRAVVYAADRAAINAADAAGFSQGRDSSELEYRIIRPADGALRHIHERCRLLRNGAGEVVRAMGTALDITERKQAVEALLESRELLHAILNSIPVRVFWKDSNLKYLGCNAPFARDAGFEKPEEVVGQDDFAMGWRAEAERYRADDRAVIEGGTVRLLFEEPQTTPAGEQIHLLTSKLPLRDAGGAIVGVLGTYLDITNLKRAEEERENLRLQLFQSQKMESIGRLAGGVAHDFNNMLGVIMGYAQMALTKVAPQEPLYRPFSEILRAAERSAEIARQLLAFARRQTISPQVLDLNETVEGMLKMLRRLIGEDIELAWFPGAGLWQVKLDPVQVDQILVNLCVNARDAIGGTGVITVKTENVVFQEEECTHGGECLPGEFVLLAVTDDGCGMDQQIRERVFEPFFTTKELGRGTGLGLATVYGIVKQNNGSVQVLSAVGRGTTFKLFLPRTMERLAESESEPREEPPLGHGEVILLVEDEPVLMAMSKTMLEHLGYRVLAAGTAGEALGLYEQHRASVALLLSDVVMPEMNGRELADRMHRLAPALKILFMSGYPADRFGPLGILDEQEHFIQKPFSLQELAIKVHLLLQDKV
ncbi:MAG: hypothetical protein BWK76_12560 [Desulfobulbaceae bacterium A2]|nr:MAG: hypothetical protein BWK76_12560 [Desulfobulbaceae bacterium A2]